MSEFQKLDIFDCGILCHVCGHSVPPVELTPHMWNCFGRAISNIKAEITEIKDQLQNVERVERGVH